MSDPTVIVLSSGDYAALLRRIDSLEARLATDENADDPQFGPCKRCGYGPWRSRRRPISCPQCRSAYWDREPRMATARHPEDPPRKEWRAPKRRRTAAVAAPAPAVMAPAPTRPVVILPPELRPPGEELIPPPPRIADAAPAPPTVVEHVAAMPDSVVEAIVAGGTAGYEEIRAAKEDDDASASDAGRTGTADGDTPPSVREGAAAEPRPTDPNLQAKKDAFFTGYVPPADVPAPLADATPFVTPTDAAVEEARRKEDPFWK